MNDIILINKDLCTRCGICSLVCPLGIIDAANERDLPKLEKGKEAVCISCGHCEVSCPSGALSRAGSEPGGWEEITGTKEISPATLSTYIKSRRSVRHYRKELVDRETIARILDVARYAATGGNRQPVEWLVIHDPSEVKEIAGLTVGWMRSLGGSGHPMAGYVSGLIAAWDHGVDVICRGAPHLVIPHIPDSNPIAPTDAIIALTHVDIVAPAFGVGTCWAGFVAGAAREYAPLQNALALPDGRIPAYAMMLGYPEYKTYRIPGRKPLRVIWR
jgi:nitroreductase/NAD-dependent dihydropyrimidine dehydrogenase PreA subunit